ncbi:MAG: hypothetical protein QY306_02045 [Anaerolineales bacterium]|nr:MAG: hypothetical protein QY306_02045 [Anaerolineales bacterium]
MNRCSQCGKVTLQGTLCEDCRNRLEKQEVNAIVDKLKQRLQAGQTIYLYQTIYLSVDSVLMEQKIGDDFDISKIRKLGLEGWEVTQSIPKTLGVGLSNHAVGFSGGQSWGGGVGGNVVGVYIILKKVLRNIDDLSYWRNLESYIQSHFSEFSGF